MTSRKLPKVPPTKEKDVSKAVKAFLNALSVEWYSTEAGYLAYGSDAEGWRPRPGGTRTTPGIPDIFAYPETQEGYPYTFTVEVKGASTAIKDEQWRYARNRMRRGEAHLIVRSVDALITGLAYLGIMPPGWEGQPEMMVWNQDLWPDNLNFLLETRGRMEEREPWRLLSRHTLTDTLPDEPPRNRKKRPEDL